MQRASPQPAETVNVQGKDAGELREIAAWQGLLPLLLLSAGLALRIYFQRRWAFIATDSLLYQDVAHNWLYGHIYGLSTGVPPHPTLIRLPGYPAILAALAWVFDRFFYAAQGSLRSFRPVLCLQIVADLATCWLVSRLARRIFNYRAGVMALALACLCPFTANYTAVPLTETFTLFFLVLTFWALGLWCDRPSAGRLAVLAVAIAAGIMLRPDQGLLVVCVLPVLYAFNTAAPMRNRLTPVVLCAVMVAVPFAPWTLRNWRTFHIIQPLSPKQAVDPGDTAPLGFEHWFRTWAVDFTANDDAYWNYPEDPILVDALPARAFDTPAQRDRTVALVQRATAAHKLDPQVETDFVRLGDERVAAHPLRYYVVLPIARLLNMLFHPRVEMLPVDARWWQYSAHPAQTLFAWLYGALNVVYYAAALAGVGYALRSNRLLTLSMLGYLLLRCALLLTIDNAEQRYTLEFLPIAFVLGGGISMRVSAAKRIILN